MFELTINDTVYQFNFGMGFMRDINKNVTVPVDGLPGVKQKMGMSYAIAKVIDGDIETLVEVLDIANKGKEPRITRPILDAYIEDENTDIEALFGQVIDFFKHANVTKKTTQQMLAAAQQATTEK